MLRRGRGNEAPRGEPHRGGCRSVISALCSPGSLETQPRTRVRGAETKRDGPGLRGIRNGILADAVADRA